MVTEASIKVEVGIPQHYTRKQTYEVWDKASRDLSNAFYAMLKEKPLEPVARPEPTEEQIRTRQRTGVTQALAAVHRTVEAVEKLGSKPAIRSYLRTTPEHIWSNDRDGKDNSLVRHLLAQIKADTRWDKALPVPTIRANYFTGGLIFESGPFQVRYTLPKLVQAVLFDLLDGK